VHPGIVCQHRCLHIQGVIRIFIAIGIDIAIFDTAKGDHRQHRPEPDRLDLRGL